MSQGASASRPDAAGGRGLVRIVETLLYAPSTLGAGPAGGGVLQLGLVAAGAFVVYGLAAGSFQGGGGLLLAGFKAPLIVLGSLALCLPSLFGSSALSGSRVAARGFALAIAGFAAVLGFVMLGLVPIVWLFSVSSRSLAFVAWLHVGFWIVAIGLAARTLRQRLDQAGASGALGAWLLLLVIVSFQMATYLRPVLWRDSGQPVFAEGKKFFLEHFRDVHGE